MLRSISSPFCHIDNLRKKSLFYLFIICLWVGSSCTTDDVAKSNIPPIPDDLQGPYEVIGNQIMETGHPKIIKGVNALQTYGLVDPYALDEWNVEVTREFIGNLNEQPIAGDAVKGSDGIWYHSLRQIVNNNRAHDRITILCPFGWLENGKRILFTGLNPSTQSFYSAYKEKMRLIAAHFRNQPDVWIEVWNEPYHWDNKNSYNHELWLSDMADMVDNLRWISGFENIVVVPGNEQGQSELAMLTQGHKLLDGRFNIIFDLHAYEKWLVSSNEAALRVRMRALSEKGLAVIFGEVGVQNVGEVMPVEHFLGAAHAERMSVLAWLWNKNSGDNNALLADDGSPNASPENLFWGLTYRDFLNK